MKALEHVVCDIPLYLGRIDATGLGPVSAEIALSGKIIAHAFGVTKEKAIHNANLLISRSNSHDALVALAQDAASDDDSSLAKAHAELSDCLEDESANDEQTRDAAVALCEALLLHMQKAKSALANAEGAQ